MADNGSEPWIVFPVSNFATLAGFVLAVVASIAIAKRIPYVKNLL